MKRISFFPVLCLCALAFSSCKDRFNESGAEGRVISFSATAGFPSLLTKTQYSGEDTSDGDYERINWTAGDKIAILSPEAMIYDQNATPWVPAPTSTNPPFSRAEYSISGTVTPDGRYSRAGIVGTGSGGSLHWGSGAHRFYGVYPSSFVEFTTNLNGAAADITVSIPKDQRPASGVDPAVSTSGGVTGTHVYPDMQNAWMYSAQYAPESDKPVQLFFSPMVTAFQISVRGLDATEVPLTRFELLSQNCGLQGPFVARVQASGVVDRTHLDRMTVSYSGGLDNRVPGENDAVWFTLPEGTVVSSTKELTFTLFTYPRGTYAQPDYLDGLSLRCVSGGTTRELKLMDKDKNNWVQFPAGRKINIKGITLPEQVSPWTFSVTAEDWEEELSDVVVSPVQMTEFENQEGGELGDRAYKLEVDWESVTWDESGGFNPSFATVRSYRDNVGNDPVPYQLEYYDETAASWKPWISSAYPWLGIPAPASAWGGSYLGETLELTMSEQIPETPDSHRQALQGTKDSGNVPRDLSLYNVATGETVERTTANCYVIRGYGEFRFPLVYGNALKNGDPNPDAYSQGSVNSTGFLMEYKDHLDQNITSPFIGVQYTGKTLEPVIVWSDVPGLITDPTVVGIGNGAYLNFRVRSATIAQGNAILGVLVDGELAWSWHIWVTDQDLTVNGRESQLTGANGFVFSPANLGWCDGVTETFRARSCSLRVRQPVSDLVSDVVVVKQLEQDVTYDYPGSSPYYQWGRKDPFPRVGTSRSGGLAHQRKLYNAASPAYAPQYQIGQKVSIGRSIREPYNHFSTPDWEETRHFNLWNSALSAHSQTDAPLIKTIYDPSPVGYMVPPVTAWDGFNAANFAPTGSSSSPGYGFTYTKDGASIFFPAMGRIDHAGSEIYQNVRESAFYWSSTPAYAGNYYLSRTSSAVSNTQNQYSGLGYAVRPICEPAAGVGTSEDGCFAVSILQDRFPAAGGTSSIQICSSDYTETDGYYQSCAPGLAWHVAGYSTDRATWTTTSPSWLSLSRLSGRPVADEDVQFDFTVAPLGSETSRFVMVKLVQDTTGNVSILYISQGTTGGSAEWKTNLIFGFDNSVCGSGNTILGSGNYIMGYDNRSEGVGNVSVGYSNTSIGNENYSIGTGNYNRGTANTCLGDYNTCWGTQNICGGSWRYEYGNIVIGDADWNSWFGE